MRHGKSSWQTPCQDKDRPLIQRGIDDANSVSIKSLNSLPDNFVIYSSSGRRASETAKIFANTVAYPLENIIFSDDLYTFDSN